MNHFFASSEQIDETGRRIVLSGKDVNHIRNVLRLNPGDTISVSDGVKRFFTASIEEMSKESIQLSILNKICPAETRKRPLIRLVQGIAKGAKMDWIIQKATELGVDEIQPVLTNYTIVRLQGDGDRKKKCVRWQEVAEAAAKQSRRLTVPTVGAPCQLHDFLQQDAHKSQNHLRLVADERRAAGSLKEQLKTSLLVKSDEINLYIGPEGGFSEKEFDALASQAASFLSLGPQILRTDTAGLVLLALVLYEAGFMNEHQR